jgi:hypothetical protein
VIAGYIWTAPVVAGSVPRFLYAVILPGGAIAVPLPGDDEVVVENLEAAEEIIRRIALEEMGEVL